MRLETVQSSQIDEVWREVAPLLEMALDTTDREVFGEDIHADLVNAHRQLWVVREGEEIVSFAVTQIIQYPRLKVGQITLGAGKSCEKWVRYVEPISAWFKSIGCDSIEIIGRKGWERVFRHYGFEHSHTSLRRSL